MHKLCALQPPALHATTQQAAHKPLTAVRVPLRAADMIATQEKWLARARVNPNKMEDHHKFE